MPDVNDRYCRCFIYRTAQTLVDEGFYQEHDLDDVVQDLTLHLLEQADQYDPTRARWTTFVRTVVEHQAISMRRHRSAQCRSKLVASLDVKVRDSDGQAVPLGTMISEEEYAEGKGHQHRDRFDEVDVSEDVQAMIENLSPEMQEVCELLKTQSVAATARQLGIPRSTLLNRLQSLRDQFEDAGLRDCL